MAGTPLLSWLVKTKFCRFAALVVSFSCLLTLHALLNRPTGQRLPTGDAYVNNTPRASHLVRSLCARLRAEAAYDVEAKYELVLRWLCKSINEPLFKDPVNEPLRAPCISGIAYQPIGRLGNLMGLYAIIYSISRKYGVPGYVEPEMRETLRSVFPGITLNDSDTVDDNWSLVTYQQVKSVLECHDDSPVKAGAKVWITNYPDRNGIDVFHPFYSELRQQFQFSKELQTNAQTFLHSVSAHRPNLTYIGFHIRRTDYRDYIRRNYNMTVPEHSYYMKAMQYYRTHYDNPLFVVSSDDMAYVSNTSVLFNHKDVVLAGNGALDSPARDMAILAACNHSVVTVGTYGFWAAYLAGGTVLVPELQSHIGRGDRGTPLLEIQLAGADNWVSIS